MSTIPLDYETLRLIWWLLLGVLLIGFAVMGGRDLGVGALLPSLSIMVVEFSNEKRGNLFLAFVHIGFAIGAILGAAIGAMVVETYGWRAIFLTGGIITSVTTIACYTALPESVNFLLARQPPNALARVNKIRQRFVAVVRTRR